MTPAQEIRQQVSTLSDSEKAALAADLLDSLPPVLEDEDEGLTEARRRDEELERHPNIALTWDQLRQGIGR